MKPKYEKISIQQNVWTFAPGRGIAILSYPDSISAADLEDFKSWLELQTRKINRLSTKQEGASDESN